MSFQQDGLYIKVWTDGACVNNGFAGAKAGLGVWFGENHPWNTSERVPGRQASNRAEILAVVKALKMLKESGYNHVKIFTDSQFTINCATKWMQGFKERGWMKTGRRGDDTDEALDNEVELRELDQVSQGMQVIYVHLARARNKEADRLAGEGCQKPTSE